MWLSLLKNKFKRSSYQDFNDSQIYTFSFDIDLGKETKNLGEEYNGHRNGQITQNAWRRKKKERVQHKDKIKALVMYKRRIKLYLTWS